MARKPNYGFEKRRKELKRQDKQEARQKRREEARQRVEEEERAAGTPAPDETGKTP